jgi:hypothetical protein
MTEGIRVVKEGMRKQILEKRSNMKPAMSSLAIWYSGNGSKREAIHILRVFQISQYICRRTYLLNQ